MIPRRLLSTLFPYTTLFRSSLGGAPASAFAQQSASNNFVGSQMITGNLNIAGAGNGIKFPDGTILTTATNNSGGAGRSEEHTSELQSLRHLVCRLLLEKKKN